MKSIKEKLCWVYMTFGSMKEAKHIGKILVEKELVACVNILGEAISIYKWAGDIEEGIEVAMVAKTRCALMPKLIKIVTKKHSYDCPCILALPIQGGFSEFLKWIETETDKNNI